MGKLIDVVWEFIKGLFKRKIRPATKVSYTFISHEENMEQYRISWVPSASNFAQDVYVKYRVDGGGEQTSPVLPPSATNFDLMLPTGGSCEVWVQTIGDNASLADSTHLFFDVLNQEQIQPATGVTATWIAHIP